MLELAGVGAKVLQVRSVGLAMRENLPLRVLSAFEDRPGTDIVAELSGDEMERNLIAGIAADRNEARITLTGVPDKPGTVAQVISPIAEAGIQVDMIVHAATPNSGSSDLTFTVPRASLAQAMAVIEQRRAEIGYATLIHDDAVAKVSIVGVGIRSNPQLAAKMFEVLAERQINLLAVSTSEIKVSALIAEAELELAVRVLHTAFGLDDGESGMSGEGLIAEPRAVHASVGHARLKELMHRGTEFLGCDVAIMGGAMSWISRAQPRLRHLQRRRVRRDRLRRDGPRAARHRDRRDQGAHRAARSASTSSPCIRS